MRAVQFDEEGQMMNRTILLATLSIAGLASLKASIADDYYQQLERRLEQIDRDRVNFSRSDNGAAASGLFAAIAYSPKTGKYGYSYSHGSQSAACSAALKFCKEPDAQIVGWAKNRYCALAEGADGYGFGHAATAAEARQIALNDCARRTTGGKIVICVFSGR